MATNLHNYSVVQAGNASLGQAGSILVISTTAATALNGDFVAIQILEDAIFDSDNATGLVSATDQSFPSSEFASTSISTAGGAVADGVTFPQGMTIYGRWSSFKLASGKVIAYLG